ncbi:YibE/F family protein [bacterium]|nr:YibE/F family protein [bacterium]
MKKLLAFIIFFIVALSVKAEEIVLPSQIGLIKNIDYVEVANNISEIKQVAKVEIIKGELKGNEINIDNMLTGNPYYDIKLKKGMKVILHVENIDNELIFSIADIKRSSAITWLSLVFCGLLIYVGRRKGINSLISIGITCLLITNILAPMILACINPILATTLICIASTVLTMYLVGGFNYKSTSAIIGCTLSLLVAYLLSIITVNFAHLTGYSNENSIFLYTAHPELNFIAITISAIIIATLGAVMDIAMSIASTINEIYITDNTKTTKELFISGMNVGRDIIGTMANTLILVYLGSSLPFLLLASNIDFQKFINLNQVVTEISSALIGSSALIICVPITAIIASNLVKKSSIKFDKLNI